MSQQYYVQYLIVYIMGKISVKHYLNKKVQPRIDPDTSITTYPIYYYITASRKTIHKPSQYGIFVSEDEFQQISSDVDNSNSLNMILTAESKLVTKICECFFEDYNNDTVKTDLSIKSKRGYTSKDDIVNGINMYIEYYSQSIVSMIETWFETSRSYYFAKKLTDFFDLTMFDNSTKGISLNVRFSEINEKTVLFYKQNTTDKLYKLHLLCLFLYACDEIIYSDLMGLHIIDWTHGNLRNELFDMYNRKEVRDFFTELAGNVKLSKNDINDLFVSFIDKILVEKTPIGDGLKYICD